MNTDLFYHHVKHKNTSSHSKMTLSSPVLLVYIARCYGTLRASKTTGNQRAQKSRAGHSSVTKQADRIQDSRTWPTGT